MKKILTAILATGLVTSAFAQAAAPQSNDQAQAAPTVPGAAEAGQASQGTLTAVYVGMGVAAAATIAGASSGGGHGNDNTSPGTGGPGTGGTTGTTGTH
ncbi:hypothetical protein ASG87_18610 [Frateuria sp. Soil773]|uniref:hypothetical protein n=1 Tax=Frateuria sp. Soil773 TaxID=1736407 RepID=UPI0006FAF2D2|nr:hypothetical protein [Frateuria sp. Soil773]KRE91164.1 hypothetical protein ASG87_18610 [Frateuria sp. Soil773]